MEVEIVLGRPGVGKTAKVISLLNDHPGTALLVSLEDSPSNLSKRGLKNAIALYWPNRTDLVTLASIVEETQKAKATLVAIENLELLPLQVKLEALKTSLEEVGVEHLIISSHLRRNLVCTSKARIDKIQAKCTVINEPHLSEN